MQLTWFGKGAFEIKSGKATAVFNPMKTSSIKKGGAVTVLSHTYMDEYHESALKDTYVADWPGEYEIQDILIVGKEIEESEKGGVNTMFNLTFPEGISVCHLGEMKKKMNADKLEILEKVDVLILPIGGENVLDAKTAKLVVDAFQPSIIVPAYYENDEQLDLFMKEMGADKKEAVDTIKIDKSDITDNETVVILKARA